MPESCEIQLSRVNSCVYYAHQIREIYHMLPYSVDFKAPSKSSFIWIKGLLSIWNDRKVEK